MSDQLRWRREQARPVYNCDAIKKTEFVLFSHEQQEELISWSTSNQTHNRGNNQSNINTNDRNRQSDKKRRKIEAKVQRKMIASAVAAGLASIKEPSGKVEVSAVEAAAITAAVTDALNANNKNNNPPTVVVDTEAVVPTAVPMVKSKSVGQKLNLILNKAKKWGCPARLLEATEQRDIFHF